MALNFFAELAHYGNTVDAIKALNAYDSEKDNSAKVGWGGAYSKEHGQTVWNDYYWVTHLIYSIHDQAATPASEIPRKVQGGHGATAPVERPQPVRGTSEHMYRSIPLGPPPSRPGRYIRIPPPPRPLAKKNGLLHFRKE